MAGFSREQIADLFTTYSNCLGELSGQRPSVYRARGFCVGPFVWTGPALTQVGTSIDQWGVDLGKRPAKSVRELIADDGQYEGSNDSTHGLPARAKRLKT